MQKCEVSAAVQKTDNPQQNFPFRNFADGQFLSPNRVR